MDKCENSICSFDEIKKIIEFPEKYFIKENIYQIIDIGTNMSILLDKKNPNFLEKPILDSLSYFFSHRYLLIKVEIDGKYKDYTIGLGEDTDRTFNCNGKIKTKTQLYIPDWSVYSEYSKCASGVNLKYEGTERDMFKGNCIFSGKLNYNQTRFLINIHKYLILQEYITCTKKYYILIDLPFIYSHLGYFYSKKIYDKIIFNCRDFVNFFKNNIKLLNTMTMDNIKTSFSELDDWIIVNKIDYK